MTSLVTLVNAVLPGMRSRGSGAILVGHGVSAVHGAPFMSGVGPAMAAARNYLYSLHEEVKDEGIYVGTIAVAAMIEGSAGQKALLSGELGVTMPEGTQIPTVSPDDLAALYWTMMTDRTRVEQIFPFQA